MPVGPSDIGTIDPVTDSNAKAQRCFDLREVTACWLDAALLPVVAADDLDDGAICRDAGAVYYVDLNPVVVAGLIISQKPGWRADLGQYHVMIAVSIDVRIGCSATDNRTRQVVLGAQ